MCVEVGCGRGERGWAVHASAPRNPSSRPVEPEFVEVSHPGLVPPDFVEVKDPRSVTKVLHCCQEQRMVETMCVALLSVASSTGAVCAGRCLVFLCIPVMGGGGALGGG